MASTLTNRNRLLDIAKGVAIILVVIGHEVQYSASNFDQLRLFRFIYAFHMPFFILLSGAAYSFAIGNLESKGVGNDVLLALQRSFKAVVRLILPFFAWGGVSWVVGAHEQTFLLWVEDITKHTDKGLWFLVCVFYCVCVLSFCLLVYQSITNVVQYPFKRWMQGFFCIAAAWLLKSLPGDLYGFALFKINYIYFAIGFFCYQYICKTSLILRFFVFVIFLSGVQFWTRVGDFNIDFSVNPYFYPIAGYFPFVVGLTGAICFVIFANYIFNNFGRVSRFLAFLGQASLGIYAMHYYFIGKLIPVAFPLISSLLLTLVLQRIAVVRLFLLGSGNKQALHL